MISFEFVVENLAELEADFQREYGIDLREALYSEDESKRIGMRRLSNLVAGLSPRSTTFRKVYGDGSEWGSAEEILSVIAELIDVLNRLTYSAATGKTPNWKPLRIPRPYQNVPIRSEPRRPSTASEIRAFFKGGSGSVSVA